MRVVYARTNEGENNMSDSKKNQGRRRPGSSVFTTKSGTTIKLHRSLSERYKAHKDAKARRRAAYLSTLPKNRFKRVLARLQPKRLAAFWFSRDGAIMALKITGTVIVLGFVIIVGLFAYFRKDLPNITDLSGNIGATASYYDRTDQTLLWQDTEAIKRIPVSTENISKFMKDATVAIEDKDFYKHGAVDLRGIIRAGFNDVFNRSGGVQGGSTISQQLVKLNREWTADRSVGRKIKELILAVELEREYSKTDILTGYLNIAPYGGMINGSESAAREYFGTTAKDLNLAQSALLAGIPQSPTFYSPYIALTDQETRGALIGRQHYILDQMVSQKMITKEEAEAAKNIDILATIKPRQKDFYENIHAPYFVLAAKDQLEEKYSSETVVRSGWRITTTLDLNLQKIAEEQVSKGMKQVRAQHGDNAAFVAEDVKTGQVLALVGGADFNQPDYGQINFATQKLPPGSSFKPYDYVSLMENTTNSGAGSVLYDVQQTLPGYPCTNKSKPSKTNPDANCLWDYDFRYPDALTIRYALGGSRNVPAVKAMLTVGVNKTIATAEALGLTSGYKCYPDDETLKVPGPCYGSSAIGDGAYLHLDEHVNGFASIARLGSYIPQTYILKVVDSKGKLIDEWHQPKGKQVVRQDAAYIVVDILKDPKASYMARKIHNYKGWEFGVKTGTTNDAKDGWMMGFSTQYAAGVWVGVHDRNHAMSGFMETMTTPIWQGWMNAAHDNIKPTNWTRPDSVKILPAYVVRNHVGSSTVEPSPTNDLFPSWYQPPKIGAGAEDIDIVSNKTATSCTPDGAKKKASGANSQAYSSDIFWPIGASSSTANTGSADDVHNCNDTKPSITLTTPTSCTNSSDCLFTVVVTQGTHPISSDAYPGTINLIVNGQKVDTWLVSESPSSHTFAYQPTSPGTASVTAEIIDSVLYSTTSDAHSVTFN